MAICAIIDAVSRSSMISSEKNRVFEELLGKKILARTLEVFESHQLIEKIIIIAGKNEERSVKNVVEENNFQKIYKLVEGTTNLTENQINTIKSLREEGIKETDLVVLHKGTKPLVTRGLLNEGIDALNEADAVIFGLPVNNIIKIVDENSNVIQTPDRRDTVKIQRPEIFKYGIVMQAIEKAQENGFISSLLTDLIEKSGFKVKVVAGSHENINIVTNDDLKTAEKIIEHRTAFNRKENNSTWDE